MTLSLDEFLRRFLLHLLPKGFVRIRHFGFLANRRRSTLLPLCFAALAQLHPRPNQRPPPPTNRTLFGVAQSVADRWRSSNDLLLLKSNSVLHHGCSILPHETALPQLANSARFTALRPRPSYSRPDRYFAPAFTPSSTIDSRSHPLADLFLRFRADSRQLQHLCLTPFNLHKARVRRASGFLLTAFSNARPNPLFRSPRARLRKSTSVTQEFLRLIHASRL
jgi:hypothetical protein